MLFVIMFNFVFVSLSFCAHFAHKSTTFFCEICKRKIHFSYKFLIRLTHFSYKIPFVSAHFSDFKSKSSMRCPSSIPEDVPIDLGVIATSRSGRTNVTEKWEAVGKDKRKPPTRHEPAVSQRLLTSVCVVYT